MVSGVKDFRLRDWRRLVGETGDLADIIVTTLSLASVEYGVSKIRISDFYRIFSQLQHEFPRLIPELYATRTGVYVYSKTLADALENALRLGVEISSPDFNHLEVRGGRRNLERLHRRAGKEFVESLRPVAACLAELMEKKNIENIS